MTPQDLLDGLLIRYWRDEVTQKDAARLLGIRKGEFAELAALRRCCLIVESAVWRYFLVQFNRQFPECNQWLCQVQIPILHSPTPCSPMPSECRHYTAADVATLLPAQPRLHEPLSNAAREFAEPAKPREWDNSGMDLDRPPASDPRELPALWQQQTHWAA